MKLPDNFYVVQRRTYKSDKLVDLLSKETLAGLRRRFWGGLEAREVIGIYTTKAEALPVARKELKNASLYKRRK